MNWPSFSLFSAKQLPVCKGKISAHAITKELLRDLLPGRIVVLKHRDLDEVVAQELIDRKVKAVINCETSMSALYPTQGPLMLLQNQIPIWEASPFDFERFLQGSDLYVYDEYAVCEGKTILCTPFTKEDWLKRYQIAQNNSAHLLDSFIDNTLHYAMREKKSVMEPLPLLTLRTNLEGKHVLVVSRGHGYKKDLERAKTYIRTYKPVLLGVDGGADALLEYGYKPDVIIGDMDSVSDRALSCGAELVVHAYPDGYAPGMARLSSLGLHAQQLPCIGTSEDAALLLAYEGQCDWIVTIGAHTHMIDFMEKGREGMGSTLLVRMKIGAKLIDLKGIGMLNQPVSSSKEWAYTVLLSLGFIVVSFLQVYWIANRISHAVWKLGGSG